MKYLQIDRNPHDFLEDSGSLSKSPPHFCWCPGVLPVPKPTHLFSTELASWLLIANIANIPTCPTAPEHTPQGGKPP